MMEVVLFKHFLPCDARSAKHGIAVDISNLAPGEHPQNSGGIGVGSLFSAENLQYLWNGARRTKVTIDDQ